MQEPDSTDHILSVVPELREADQDDLAEFRGNEEFNYLNKSAPGLSLWDRFWRGVQSIINYLFSNTNPTTLDLIVRFIVYGIVAFIIGFAIYRLLLLRFIGVTKAAEENDGLKPEITEENIHELDFESLIAEALENGNYRLAIRLRYLQSLKFLSDRQIIDWEPYKTNHEYSDEISTRDMRTAFDQISYYFDYAWYGEFSVERRHFDRVGEIFDQLKRSA